MLLISFIFFALASFSCVNCLSCLHCTDIQNPRHCKYATECPLGEVCHIHQKTNVFGDVLFDLGCIRAAACSNRSHDNNACDECCKTDLCNSAGCGQPGYPQSRGPICYSCSAQTTEGNCHKIDFCGSHEVCTIEAEREFEDTVYTSQCAVPAYCEEHKTGVAAIIGRSVLDDTRSITETTCRRCCDKDLCNSDCTGTRTGITHATSPAVTKTTPPTTAPSAGTRTGITHATSPAVTKTTPPTTASVTTSDTSVVLYNSINVVVGQQATYNCSITGSGPDPSVAWEMTSTSGDPIAVCFNVQTTGTENAMDGTLLSSNTFLVQSSHLNQRLWCSVTDVGSTSTSYQIFTHITETRATTANLGESCSSYIQCTPTNSECRNSVCVCRTGYRTNGNMCNLIGIGESCVGSTCLPENSFCNFQSVCACNTGFYEFSGSCL